jgi:hypothetical protein
MEQNPSLENSSHSDSQITGPPRNPKDHHSAHKSPPLVSILSQMNPVHNLPSYFPKIHSNIIYSPRLHLLSGLFPSGFPTETQYAFLNSPICAICTAHLIFLEFINLTTFGEAYKLRSLLILQSSTASCKFHTLRSKYFPQNPAHRHKYCKDWVCLGLDRLG